MTVFPTSNLPVQTQTWGREVEKRLVNLDSSFRSAEINNVTRDSQLISNYRRLDAAVTQLTTVATQAQAAATQAQQAADDAADAAALAGTAADNAQDAIDGLGSLDEATSTYKINAANLTVGFLSGDRIQGGEIVGTTLKTSDTGRRVEIEETNTAYFDEDGNFTGRIIGAGTARGSTIEMIGPGTGMVGVWNEGAYITSQGGREVVFGGAGTVFDNSPISCQNGSPITVNGANIKSEGGSLLTNNVTIGLSSITATSGSITGQTLVSNGSVSGSSFNFSASTLSQAGDGRIASNTGFLANGPLGVTGNLTYVAPVGTGTTRPLYWNTSTNLIYQLGSSERYKTEIKDAEIDYETLLQATVRTFKNKQEVEEVGVEAAELTYGYIAEELHDLGLTDFVVYEDDENGNSRPESVNYMSMALASHAMIKHQDGLIKSLEARLTALESKVE